jgi:hypothetical protein
MNPDRTTFEKCLVWSIPAFALVAILIDLVEKFNIPSFIFGPLILVWAGIVGLIFIIKDKI